LLNRSVESESSDDEPLSECSDGPVDRYALGLWLTPVQGPPGGRDAATKAGARSGQWTGRSSASAAPTISRSRFDDPEEALDEAWKAATLASFIPDFVLAELLGDRAAGHSWRDKPRQREFEAAVAMIDLCGFTRLAERLKNEHCNFCSDVCGSAGRGGGSDGGSGGNSNGRTAGSLPLLPFMGPSSAGKDDFRQRLRRFGSFDSTVLLTPLPPVGATGDAEGNSEPKAPRRHSVDVVDAVGSSARPPFPRSSSASWADALAAAGSEDVSPALSTRMPVAGVTAASPGAGAGVAPRPVSLPTVEGAVMPPWNPPMMRQRSGSIPWDILEAQRLEHAVRAGTEKLRSVVGDLFRALMAHIVECGGDVVRLAGDAVIVLFPAEPADAGIPKQQSALQFGQWQERGGVWVCDDDGGGGGSGGGRDDGGGRGDDGDEDL
ncbi:unnamed protein product, partial [Phaeothamnion confervicola]